MPREMSAASRSHSPRTMRRIEHWGHTEHSGQVAGWNIGGVSTAYTRSDIFDTRIDYAGYHANCDECAVKGSLGEKGSCIFDSPTCRRYCAFNAPHRDLAVYNRLIKSAVCVSRRCLSVAVSRAGSADKKCFFEYRCIEDEARRKVKTFVPSRR
jgi:hypothetical protein